MRLAERRGVLTGPSLSRVQALALEMLLIVDDRRAAKDFVDSFRAGLVASNPSSMKEIFPEWFPPDPFADAIRPDGTIDRDAVKEDQIPVLRPSEEEAEDVARWVAEQMQTITAAELEQEGDPTKWH